MTFRNADELSKRGRAQTTAGRTSCTRTKRLWWRSTEGAWTCGIYGRCGRRTVRLVERGISRTRILLLRRRWTAALATGWRITSRVGRIRTPISWPGVRHWRAAGGLRRILVIRR
uniref:(northern house mosquito) hypothetical protein n=1 Tax=Culex pipiens TaxID=7175 RepID=A0A8D8CL53_CULPI